MSHDFANILFAGPCNRFCPFCIGKELPDRANEENLNLYPLRNQDAFIREVQRLDIREIVMTGTTTDPHLYRHEERLLSEMRRQLPHARFSVHTNGVLALRKLEAFNSYDRACISFPSFRSDTYEKMMGSRIVPDLRSILRESRIPVKVSCVINEHNVHELDDFILEAHSIGVRRLVLRKLFGETRTWDVLKDRIPESHYRDNPVYNVDGMEVTYWDFDRTTSKSINLFPDGTIGPSYLLAATPAFMARSSAIPG